MQSIFLTLLNLGITASWVIAAVLLLRLIVKRVPKWFHVALWALVALRLIVPISFESHLSLVPSAKTISPEIVYAPDPAIHSGIPVLNRVINPMLQESLTPVEAASVNPIGLWVEVLSYVWIAGLLLMLLYAFVSYWKLRRKVEASIHQGDNIWIGDDVPSPFILGMVRPRIYLPSSLGASHTAYVVAHERAHLARRDHWWKPMAYLLLSVYWFNPLFWLAYRMLCRDIELACDEKVIRTMERDEVVAYSETLLECSVPSRAIRACPVAFGEQSIKTRVKAALNYKKPVLWVMVFVILLSIVLSVCLLTNPKSQTGQILVNGYLYTQEEGILPSLPVISPKIAVLQAVVKAEHPEEEYSAVGVNKKYIGQSIYQSAEDRDVIYLGEVPGPFLMFRRPSPTLSHSGPVSWVYCPAMSATWHAAFHFEVDVEGYTLVDTRCEGGNLWDLYHWPLAQPRKNTLAVTPGIPITWSPLNMDSDGIDPVEDASIDFTVYKDDDVLYEGSIILHRVRASEEQLIYEYEAYLISEGDLVLVENESNMGGRIVPKEKIDSTDKK